MKRIIVGGLIGVIVVTMLSIVLEIRFSIGALVSWGALAGGFIGWLCGSFNSIPYFFSIDKEARKQEEQVVRDLQEKLRVQAFLLRSEQDVTSVLDLLEKVRQDNNFLLASYLELSALYAKALMELQKRDDVALRTSPSRLSTGYSLN